MRSDDKGYAICVDNGGAEDLEIRKVYQVLRDKDAASAGYVRVIDDSGEDYLYPADYFVFVDLPQKAKRAWPTTQRPAKRPGSASQPVARIGARRVRSRR